MCNTFDLNEEVRCDYFVTKKQKQIWECLLELLSVVDKICEENDIPYFAIGGTMLGAVRHKGFIPWDDDLDIAMLREDYNRFLRIGEREIGGKFFLQTTLTDQEYYKEHARVRNSETTGICEHLELHNCNNGIYLDILPLENYQDSLPGHIHSKISRTIGRVLSVKVHHNTRSRNSMRSHIIYLISLFLNLRLTHRWREWFETSYSRKPAKYVTLGNVYYSMYKPENLIFERKDFERVERMLFENTTIPVPVGYDRILRINYGDYMQFPPIEKRGLHHNIVFDPETPYKEYIEKNRDELAQLKFIKKNNQNGELE